MSEVEDFKKKVKEAIESILEETYKINLSEVIELIRTIKHINHTVTAVKSDIEAIRKDMVTREVLSLELKAVRERMDGIEKAVWERIGVVDRRMDGLEKAVGERISGIEKTVREQIDGIDRQIGGLRMFMATTVGGVFIIIASIIMRAFLV